MRLKRRPISIARSRRRAPTPSRPIWPCRSTISPRSVRARAPRGRAGGAEEAVSLYRALTAARPDAFTPDLAMSLNNLAISFRLGRWEEALGAAARGG